MSTGTEIITKALQKLGASSKVSPASPESITLGMDALNSMIEMWESKNIITGMTPLEVPGDELNNPRDITNGIINNLAIELAPDFDNGKTVVSPTLMRQANIGYNSIITLYQIVVVPDKVISSTTPVGAGNERYFRARNFPVKGQTIEN